MKPKRVTYKVYCLSCKNLWLLISDKEPTTKQYRNWQISINKEHQHIIGDGKKWIELF
jgi:hypothetical protein